LYLILNQPAGGPAAAKKEFCKNRYGKSPCAAFFNQKPQLVHGPLQDVFAFYGKVHAFP
jgi:hypothetical protein